MKVKTANLIGPALDWVVAKCLGVTPIAVKKKHSEGWLLYSHSGATVPLEYSSRWGQGGPIIDREGIQWVQVGGEMEAWSGFDYLEWRRNWELPPQLPQGAGFGTGPTVLSAAMRCFVASRLGDEVDVPDELMKISS